MCSSLECLSLGGMGCWSLRLFWHEFCQPLFFSRSFTTSSIVAIFLLGSVLEVIENLSVFARRSVSIWLNCQEDILITHFFSSFMLVALCVTLFLLINSSNFCVSFFLLNQKISYKNSSIVFLFRSASSIVSVQVCVFL